VSTPSLEHLFEQFMSHLVGADAQPPEYWVQAADLSEAEQIAIYTGSVQGGLIQALADIYPGVATALGRTFFDAMAQRFVSGRPSRSATLDDYGEDFPEFMERFPPLADYRYLCDLARVEWRWHRAFHMRNQSPFDPSQLASLTPEELVSVKFKLLDSLAMVQSDFALDQLWIMCREQSAQQEATLELEARPTTLVVYRSGLDVLIQVADVPTFDALQSIKNGVPFGTICDALLSNHPQADINTILATMVQHGWIAGFGVPESNKQ